MANAADLGAKGTAEETDCIAGATPGGRRWATRGDAPSDAPAVTLGPGAAAGAQAWLVG